METEPFIVDNSDANVDTHANVDCQTIKLTLVQLAEKLLQDNETIKKMNIQLAPEIVTFIQQLLIKEPQLFSICETSLQKIISDNKINANDIPDLMILITQVFSIINNFDKSSVKQIDFYELTKNVLLIIIELYAEKHSVSNENKLLLVRIVDSSIELIKLKGFTKEKGLIKKILRLCKKCSCKK